MYRKYLRSVPFVRSYVISTSLLFIFGLLLTLLAWHLDRQRVQAQQELRLNDQAALIQTAVSNKLQITEQILKGGEGLVSIVQPLTAESWQRFISQYEIQRNNPGVVIAGFIQYVPAENLQAYIDQQRAGGNPEFTVIPAGDRPVYAPLTYLEPLSDGARRSLGTDVLQSPQRAVAINSARDTGTVQISEKLNSLPTQANQNSMPLFALYSAVYKGGTPLETIDHRRANISGFIFTAFSPEQFFKNAIPSEDLKAYKAVQVFDGETTDPNALLYQSADFNQFEPKEISRTFTKKVYNRTWTYRFAGSMAISPQDHQRSNFILIGGTTLSAAISGFLFLLMLTRARAIAYNKQDETQRAKDDLLSLASHQLRTPATAVKQYLGMILEGYTGKIPAKMLPSLQKAYAGNERQLDTINQILYVAKADAGRLSINKARFDITTLVDEIILDLTDALEAKDQKIVFEHPKKRIIVNADEASIRMVIENLISNASKYSHDASKIKVKVGYKKDEICIAIEDNGVGIARHDYDKLFKKFSRIDNELSLQVGGSGIGLYIDKVLIELHGGRIEVESTLGKGSTFTIYLPRDSARDLTDDTAIDGSI
jgi:signal transduction histidine kinase